ncbi:hypothetical protein ANCCAN_28541 [Ancylostoma caninum]|uniref:GCN5-related N-acetyltransferase Rv2170-like domain-containing protein n=1 Tax=Ancylostoma caninum TaxID=29170 RepID=A0A368F0X3_ANCCA|nr:hypothetical protein ANCCAN_28541 [Ancylostoma caninum]
MIMLKEHGTPQEKQKAFELSENNPDLLLIHAALFAASYERHVKLFAYPSSTPTYWFLLNIQKNAAPFVIVAQDGDSYDKNTFLTALKLFSAKTGILETEEQIEFGAEAHLMHEIAKFVMQQEGHRPGIRREHHVFYMTPDQMERVQKVECSLPYGFEESNLTLEDAEEVCIQSDCEQPIELVRQRIEYLPSSCIRQSSTGVVVSRELRSFSGAMVDQYTMPEHRRQGLGQAVEISLAQKIISLDETPFKLVPTYLTSILLSSQESPFWSMWSRNTFPVSYVLQAFRKTL